jgi:hypothetical protein
LMAAVASVVHDDEGVHAVLEDEMRPKP